MVKVWFGELKATWKDGSEHSWHGREKDWEFRQQHSIPTDAAGDLMPKDQKAEMVRRLLYWADDVGVPNNSQIREILAGLMRTLTQEWMIDSKSEWNGRH